MLPCLFKSNLGIDCPGCGLQRSFMMLMEGDIVGSIAMYPALIPLMAMFMYLGLHLKLKFKKGHTVLTIMYIANSAIIVANYIYKLSNHH